MTKAIIQVFSENTNFTKVPICCKIKGDFKKDGLGYSMKNGNLNKARKLKNDEFYTLYSDIEKELVHYEQHFMNKVVYCNCDDPRMSNFTRYFIINFKRLGLKKLICTGYKEGANGVKLELTLHSNTGITALEGDGSYNSKECLEFLKEADIVVTNPPFSLFRDYFSTLMMYKKKFLIIGNVNAITYKEIFPLIQNNKVWLGCSKRSMDFMLPSGELFNVNACWFTNLDHGKRHEELTLVETYDEHRYPMFDNYAAINVQRTAKIPRDYTNVMGVPITFLDKYNPNQFEIIGITGNYNEIKWLYLTGCSKYDRPYLGGRRMYPRILIKIK